MWWGQTWKGVRCSLVEDVSLRPSVSCAGMCMAGPLCVGYSFDIVMVGRDVVPGRDLWQVLERSRTDGCEGVVERAWRDVAPIAAGAGWHRQTLTASLRQPHGQTDRQIFLFMYFSTFSFTHSDCLIYIINKLRLPNRMTFLFSFLWGVLSFLFGRKETT